MKHSPAPHWNHSHKHQGCWYSAEEWTREHQMSHQSRYIENQKPNEQRKIKNVIDRN